MRSGLSHAAHQARPADHDHPRAHAVVSAPIDLQGPAERVRPATDHLGGGSAMTEGALEVERLAKLLVVVGSRVELCEAAPQVLVLRVEPLIFAAQCCDVAKDCCGLLDARGDRHHLRLERREHALGCAARAGGP